MAIIPRASLSERIKEAKARHSITTLAARLGLVGNGTRRFCPTCQSAGPARHKTPDLALYPSSFRCYKCGSSGDCLSLVQITLGCTFLQALQWLDEGAFAYCALRRDSSPATNNNIDRQPERQKQAYNRGYDRGEANGMSSNIMKSNAPFSASLLADLLKQFQTALAGSVGEVYLVKRGITLPTAQTLGLGYAPPGSWPGRYCSEGRLVFPHTESISGGIVNLYGRAIEIQHACPSSLRHDHLRGRRGLFNAQALSSEKLIIVEGPFCAMTLAQIGINNVAATFGVSGLKWDSISSTELVFAFDQDQAGEAHYKKYAFEAVLRGKRTSKLSPSIYRGCKDLNEAYVNSLKMKTLNPEQ